MIVLTMLPSLTAPTIVAYHRTRSPENVQSIGANGFVIGQDTAAMYGRGVYLTYDFQSQQRARIVEAYGGYIVRCSLDLRDFLIFDPELAEAVYGTSLTLEISSPAAASSALIWSGLPTTAFAG